MPSPIRRIYEENLCLHVEITFGNFVGDFEHEVLITKFYPPQWLGILFIVYCSKNGMSLVTI